jgi:hypothetical protein
MKSCTLTFSGHPAGRYSPAGVLELSDQLLLLGVHRDHRRAGGDVLGHLGQYPTGLRYTKQDVDALPITRHDFHGEWNYTINPPDTP